MALEIHPNARAAIQNLLAQNLKYFQIKNGMFVERITGFLSTLEANNSLPSNGKLHNDLLEYVDELPLTEFVIGTISKEVSEKNSYEVGNNKRTLSEFEGYENDSDTAQRLIDLFVSLPWEYNVTCELSEALVPKEIFQNGPVSIGKSGRLIKPDLLFAEEFPLTHEVKRIQDRVNGSGLLALVTPDPKWKEDHTYFQESEKGYVGIYGGGNMMEKVDRKLESFFGLGLATKLFSYKFKYENKETTKKWIVHQLEQDVWVPFTGINMSKEVVEVVRHITSFRFSEDYPIERRTPWLKKMLTQSNQIFQSDLGETLLLASKWFFDSFKGTDEPLKYIRMMTTLEILLGKNADNSKVSLGEILGNRLAYLIGKNHRERSEILVEFKKIYGIRSRILHHGKHKLKSEERGLMTKLRTFCERAIAEEARLILA